jgi:hypothetical protein
MEVDELHFKRFFMTWKASKTFYNYNRKIITVDVTVLVSPNKGTLLTAVAQDEKNQLVLIAYAIVESENTDSWKFFLNNLESHFQINNSNAILMSDRDLGLVSALLQQLPIC